MTPQEKFTFVEIIHFDFRNLIGRGLAIEVTEENNPYKNKVMKAKIRFTDIVSNFTYNPIRRGYTCDEDTRDNKMVFASYELVEIKQ